MKTRLLLLVLLVAGAAASAAEVYSWTDRNGVKHFSDSPPPANVNAQKIKVRGQLTTATAAETDANAGGTTAAATEGSAEAPKNSGPALAAAAGYAPQDITRNCEIARKNLAIIEARPVPTDDQGTPQDPAYAQNHEQQLNKANQQIKLFCATP